MRNATGVKFPPPLLVIGVITLGALLRRFNPVWWPEGTAWIITGGLVFALGACLAATALLMMHRHRTHPSPFKAASALLTTGPYRFTRNPIYIGMLLVQTGTALAFALPVTLFALPLTFGLLDRFVIRYEEAFLLAHFSPAYAAYSARVRRWL